MKWKGLGRGAIALLASLALAGAVARESAAGVVLADNLSAATAGASTAEADTWYAASFSTDGSDYALTSVTLLLRGLTPDSGATVSLFGDGGLEPGTLIGELGATAGLSAGLTATTFQGGGLALSANSTYWIVLRAGAGAVDWAWTSSNTGAGPGFQVTWSQSDDAGLSWFTADNYPFQMGVTAEAVPEPSTAAAAGLGAIGLLAWSRRRRRPMTAG